MKTNTWKTMVLGAVMVAMLALFAGSASAQDDDPNPPPPPAENQQGQQFGERGERGDRQGPRGNRPGERAGQLLQTVADALGLAREDIMAQLQDGATLAEVITSNGGTVDAVVSAILTQAETHLSEAVAEGRITQEQADERLAEMSERVTDAINNGIERPDRPDRPNVRDGAREVIGAVVDATGLEARDILQQMRDGATLAEIIEANGASVDAITDSFMTSVSDHLSEQVANGNITQEQADERLARAEEMLTNLLNGVRPNAQENAA